MGYGLQSCKELDKTEETSVIHLLMLGECGYVVKAIPADEEGLIHA